MKAFVRDVWVVGCEGPQGRLLSRGAMGWAVVEDPERAHQFPSDAEAQEACDQFLAWQFGYPLRPPGLWRVYRMTLKASFR